MAGYHTVEQGEHLSGIALQYGFTDYQVIWHRPENAALKNLRRNPNVLFPGDLVFIPDLENSRHDGATDQLHRFLLTGKLIVLRLKLEKGYNRPMANAPCRLIVDSDSYQLTADATGTVEHRISKTVRTATLLVEDSLVVRGKKVPMQIEISIRIGYLDPVEELSGQRARLANLGYYRGPLEKTDEAEFRSAVEEFQCEHGLSVDGKCGPATQARLKQVHGC